ncbi:hypothetical protein BsWGS_26725 [Bradybaena similaris]
MFSCTYRFCSPAPTDSVLLHLQILFSCTYRFCSLAPTDSVLLHLQILFSCTYRFFTECGTNRKATFFLPKFSTKILRIVSRLTLNSSATTTPSNNDHRVFVL